MTTAYKALILICQAYAFLAFAADDQRPALLEWSNG